MITQIARITLSPIKHKGNMTKYNQRINEFYTLAEEIANSITHGIGAGLSVAGLTVLVVLASLYGDVWQIVSFSIYGTSLIILYLASTLYHSIQHPPTKRIFRLIDHSAIYILIAGTYTPFLLVAMRGVIGWTMLVIIWGIAILGIAFKMLFLGRYKIISTLGYVAMGWLCLVAWHEFMANVPMQSIYMLAIGGVTYTAGVIFFALEKIPYNHAIWHVFVLAGSIAHYFAVVPLLSI